MSDRLLYFIVFLAVLLPFTACEKLSDDQPGDNTGSEQKVYLSVSIQAAQAKSGLRSSINEDNTDFEDGVYSLAMLIFDSVTGAKIGGYFNANVGSGSPATRVFKVELTPGQRDFYFVANMPNLETDLAGISDRNEMDIYLNSVSRLLNDALYRGASGTEGFPMARVYLNQEVTVGGTIYQPKPLKPKLYGTEEGKVVVNVAGSGADEREYVELIRVVAKLEVILDGAANLGVDKVYFRNANRHFRLVEFETAPTAYFNDNASDTELRRLGATNTYIYYMPEAVIPSSVMWSNSGANHQPINYFTIITLNGTEYDIPIISSEASITSDYLAKAKGTFTGFTPDYNIHRNRHYKYVVKNLQQIEIIYEVDPWNVVNKSTYMGYGYNVEIDEDGNISITNTIDDCMPHKVRLVAVGGAYFGTPGNTMVEYGYESESETGYNENKSKAGYSEVFHVNSDAVATGQPYLEVYYNKVPGVGVTPDKVFTK
jgi:hypothetical protein